MLLAGPSAPAEERSAAPRVEGYAEITPPECGPVPDSYFSDAVFLGDSMASNLEMLNLFPEAEFVWKVGMSVNSTRYRQFKVKGESKKDTAIEAVARYSPKKLYILLGSNSLDVVTSQAVIKDYHAMLDSIIEMMPDTVIYVLSPPPMTARAFSKVSGPNPKRYANFEEGLRQIAQERGLYYIDLYHMVADEKGYLRRDMAAGDGYHLNQETSQALADYIKTHAVPYGNP